MNIKNNKRKRESRKKLETAFVKLLQEKELDQITVSELCKITELNRSTFYANYEDIYALADTVRDNLEQNIIELYRDEIINSFNSNDFLKLFRHIYANQLFYKTYFKLGYDNEPRTFQYDRELAAAHFGDRFIDYHIEFFKSGLNAIIKRWLNTSCRETPEEINEILDDEYRGRAEYFEQN